MILLGFFRDHIVGRGLINAMTVAKRFRRTLHVKALVRYGRSFLTLEWETKCISWYNNYY
jgi:hypothetical protein